MHRGLHSAINLFTLASNPSFKGLNHNLMVSRDGIFKILSMEKGNEIRIR